MARHIREQSECGIYHVVNRGVGKMILFESPSDYLFFLNLLKNYQEEERCSLLAYCLMDNHFHLLLKAAAAPNAFMKRISCAYAYYFNNKYERTGHLFQGRYFSEPVNDDSYLLAVVRYIHNNPVKVGISNRESYRWSSYSEYTSGAAIINPQPVMEICDGIDGFLELSQSDETIPCGDIDTNNRLSDAEAVGVLQTVLHVSDGTVLQAMPRQQRDEALKQLKQAGLTIRQIERFTGINRGAIQRV